MYLIPSPKNYIKKEGSFLIKRNTEIVLDYKCDFEDLNSAIMLQEEILKETGFKLKINKVIDKLSAVNTIKLLRGNGTAEGYSLSIKEEGIVINGATAKGRFYGVQTLRQIVRQAGNKLQAVEIKDEPDFEYRGFYHDVTRGKVPKLETLMELVDRAAFYKINQLQLYIEHSFAFKGLSEVWMDKDPLTAEEILLLDQYCIKKHIELVPSLSTFGHLYEVLKSKSFNHLCELDNSEQTEYSFVDRQGHHTVNVLNEDSIKLVENMLKQYIPLFSSNKFNICCDETFDLGKGKSKAAADKDGVGRLYVDFLNKVISIVKEYDKEIMFWGDVVLNHPEVLSEIPEDVICLNWDYSPEAKEDSTRLITATGRKTYVCPGVSGWNMIMNMMDNAFENIKRMVSYGEKYKAIGVLNTDWGDFGHVNLLANSMPGMIYGAALAWNNNGEKNFEEMYKAIASVEYGDKNLEVVALLNKLSKDQDASWYDVIVWKEKLGELPWVKERIAGLDSNKIMEGYNTAVAIEEKLTSIANNIRHNRTDIEEFISSARGTQLVNAFFLVVLKKDFNKEEVVEVIKARELAEELELWFIQYGELWRNRNKESELYRIREVINYLCNYLREV